MKKPMPRPWAYVCYLFALVFGIIAIVAFQGREYLPIWFYFGIPALILFAMPTYTFLRDLYLYMKDPEKYEEEERKRRDKRREEVQKNIELKNAEEQRKRKEHDAKHLPCCPNCGSWNTKRISTASRAASVAAVGAASGKIGKQYQCNDCKHMW